VHLICFRDFVADSRTFARAHLCFVYSIQVDSGLGGSSQIADVSQ
jgi:hypothetical protein